MAMRKAINPMTRRLFSTRQAVASCALMAMVIGTLPAAASPAASPTVEAPARTAAAPSGDLRQACLTRACKYAIPAGVTVEGAAKSSSIREGILSEGGQTRPLTATADSGARVIVAMGVLVSG